MSKELDSLERAVGKWRAGKTYPRQKIPSNLRNRIFLLRSQIGDRELINRLSLHAEFFKFSSTKQRLNTVSNESTFIKVDPEDGMAAKTALIYTFSNGNKVEVFE